MHLRAAASAVLLLLVAGGATVLRPAAAAADVVTTARLSDDAAGRPLFAVDPQDLLMPGGSRVACLRVTATGAIDGDRVTLVAENLTGPLVDWLEVTVETGTGGGYGDCAGLRGATAVFGGPLAQLADGGTDGLGTDTGWSPAPGGDARTFRLRVSVTAAAGALNRTGDVTFTWRLVRGTTPTPTGPPPTRPTTAPEPTEPTEEPTGSPTGIPATITPDPTTPPTGTPGGPTGAPGTPVATLPVPAGGPAGGTAGGGPDAGPPVDGTADTALLTRLGTALGQAWQGFTATRAGQTLVDVARRPHLSLGPLVAGLAFLLLQHLVDLRDPKIAGASRTRRQLELEFPRHYPFAVEGSGVAPGVRP